MLKVSTSKTERLNKLSNGKVKLNFIDHILELFKLNNTDLIEISMKIQEDLVNGLSNNDIVRSRSPLKMIQSFVNRFPDGSENGIFYAIDFGGTNIRIIQVTIVDDNGLKNVLKECQSYKFTHELMTGNGKDLFDYVIDSFVTFLLKNHCNSLNRSLINIKTIGFTFSFPFVQDNLTSGYLLRWTKGFSAFGVEGKNVVGLLKTSLKRYFEIVQVENIVLINDTVGTLASGSFYDTNCSIGLIVGTGTNACYLENIENVLRVEPNSKRYGNLMAINTEWGAFGEKGELDLWINHYDRLLDSKSTYIGEQTFEKLISGFYMGKIVEIIILDLKDKEIAFTELKHDKDFIFSQDFFECCHISMIESGNQEDIEYVLKEIGLLINETNILILKEICCSVSKRAAYLISAGLHALIMKLGCPQNVSIAVDGSVIRKNPLFIKRVQSKLQQLLPNIECNIRLAEDGSGFGAALISSKY